MEAKVKWVLVVTTIGAIVFYYAVNDSDYTMLFLFSLIAICGIACKGKVSEAIFQNKLIKRFGSISMEVYLCHMFVYRVLERIKAKSFIPNQILSYMVISIITIIGAVVMAIVLKRIVQLAEKLLHKAA